MFFLGIVSLVLLQSFRQNWRHINKIKTSVPASVNYLYEQFAMFFVIFHQFLSGSDLRSILSSVTQRQCPNTSTIPIRAIGCQQCLSLSVVQLKGKRCWNLHCRCCIYVQAISATSDSVSNLKTLATYCKCNMKLHCNVCFGFKVLKKTDENVSIIW